MDRANEWLSDTPAKWDRERHTWHFPSGASLTFGYIQTPRDKYRYQSAEFQYIGWDEITEFPDDDAYTFLASRLRRLEGSDIPLRIRSASNPVGQGAYWVRDRFITNPVGDRIFIAANFYDNPYIDKDAYLLSLSLLPEATQERLIEGSWEAIDSAAFPHFDKGLHIIPQIAVPQHWRRWEAMDFGVTNPTAWYAAALSPEVITVIFGEYYNPGLISDHASAIHTLRHNSWGQPTIALCDPSIQNRTGFGSSGRGETVHSEFSKHGIYLVPANNDRRAGRVRLAEMLRPDPSRYFPDWHERAGEMGAPSLFLTENVKVLPDQITYAPVDPVEGEVVDPFWESRHGHGLAAARYLLTAKVFPEDRKREGDEVYGRRIAGTWNPGNQWREYV
jgi:hypothetical protein